MADITLTAAPPLAGADIALGQNRIVERADLALVSVAIPQGGDDALAARLSEAWGLHLPRPTLSAISGEIRAIRTAPDQILLILPQPAEGKNTYIADRLGGAGYTTTQTDAWAMLEISGPDTLAALERICPLDLDTRTFPPGAASRTVMEHVGTLILRLDTERFVLMCASSYAQSFLHAVETSYRNVVT